MKRIIQILLFCLVLFTVTPSSAEDAASQTQSAEPTNSADTTSANKANVLPAGLPVKLRLLESLLSQSNRKGDKVTFEVAEDIVLNGQVVVPKGALAYGQVTESKSRKGLGRSGNIQVEVYHIALPQGIYIPLVTSFGEASGMQGGKVLARWVFFGPLVGLTTRGKKVDISCGTEVDVFIGENTDIPPVDEAALDTLRTAIIEQRRGLAIEAAQNFGFGRKKVKDVLIEKGLADASWSATEFDEYTYQVSAIGLGQTYSWLVNPFQEIYGKKFLDERIKGIDKPSEDIVVLTYK
jgi:hypothetical protein